MGWKEIRKNQRLHKEEEERKKKKPHVIISSCNFMNQKPFRFDTIGSLYNNWEFRRRKREKPTHSKLKKETKPIRKTARSSVLRETMTPQRDTIFYEFLDSWC